MITPPTSAQDINVPAAPAPDHPRRPALRPALEAVAFVAVWVALGVGPVRDPLAYLLLGIPLTAIFQLTVRRRPLAELWIGDGRFRRPPATAWAVTTAVLAVVPLWTAGQALMQREWMSMAWASAACCGAAVGAGVVLQRRARSAPSCPGGWPRGIGAAIGAVSIGAALFTLSALLTPADRSLSPLGALGVFIHSTLLYLPAVFVLEEVTFRGCLDAHLWRPGSGSGRPARGRAVCTAVLSSWLWGLWHLPLVAGGSTPWLVLIPYLVTVHTLMGIPLAVAWRRSGSLTLPAAAHAVIDGIRNAVLTT